MSPPGSVGPPGPPSVGGPVGKSVGGVGGGSTVGSVGGSNVGNVGAWVGARWGLIGLIYGVTLGWVSRGAVAGALAAKLLRSVPTSGLQPAALVEVPNPTHSARDDRRGH